MKMEAAIWRMNILHCTQGVASQMEGAQNLQEKNR